MLNKYSPNRRILKAFVFICFVQMFCMAHTSSVLAEVKIERPVPGAVTSDFKLRTMGGVTRAHKGTDYSCATGTSAKVTSGYKSLDYRPLDGNAAGRRLHVHYDCGVKVSYFHLSSYSAGPPPDPKCGSSGSKGDGSYDPHLHFEIRIDGQPVDPEAAYGLDLCDATIASCLKTDGAKRLSGAIAGGKDQGVCGAGEEPYTGPDPVNPSDVEDTGTVPVDDDSSSSRPPIAAPSYPPPTNSGGLETGVGPDPGGTVLWDDSEYLVGDMTTNACDSEIFVVMRGRAAMEAQEDIITSEIVIHRPDSVLEYTCADQWIGYTAEKAGPLFSETNKWVNRTIPLSVGGSVMISVHLDPTSLDQVLEDTVIKTIYDYVENQFPLDYLGDTATGMDSNISDTIGGATYTCTMMKDIWQVAKCENFGDTDFFVGAGPFYTYNELIPKTSDPRVQYNQCNDTGLQQIDKDVMTNKNLQYHGYSAAALYGKNIHDYVDPANCTGLEPIPTGVHVVQVKDYGGSGEDITEYEEHFCANPGCYYDHTNDKCSK